MSAGGLSQQEERLDADIDKLKSFRKGDGRWHRFPFYYTLLALSEIDLPSARQEMRYAAPVLERIVNRSSGTSPYRERRKSLAEMILAGC